MSDNLFEVAFSGQISDGADLDEVKVRVGALFKADEAKLAQLFSGKRIVIKKSIDQPTAAKYQSAFTRAGAVCEVKSLFDGENIAPGQTSDPLAESSQTAPEPSVPAERVAESEPPPVSGGEPVQTTTSETTELGEVPPPPNTDPLGITGDQIDDLSATVAPVGSELQDEIKEVVTPIIDTSDLDVAPVGSIIGTGNKDPDPPPPDTTGLSMVD